MFIWFWNRKRPHNPCKPPYRPHRPGRKPSLLSILLIVFGLLLVMVYTPPWVWFVLIGLSLIIVGILSLDKWR